MAKKAARRALVSKHRKKKLAAEHTMQAFGTALAVRYGLAVLSEPSRDRSIHPWLAHLDTFFLEMKNRPLDSLSRLLAKINGTEVDAWKIFACIVAVICDETSLCEAEVAHRLKEHGLTATQAEWLARFMLDLCSSPNGKTLADDLRALFKEENGVRSILSIPTGLAREWILYLSIAAIAHLHEIDEANGGVNCNSYSAATFRLGRFPVASAHRGAYVLAREFSDELRTKVDGHRVYRMKDDAGFRWRGKGITIKHFAAYSEIVSRFPEWNSVDFDELFEKLGGEATLERLVVRTESGSTRRFVGATQHQLLIAARAIGEEAESQEIAAARPSEPDTPLQIAILAALDGRALKKEPLADAVGGGDGSRLYKTGGIKELMQAGRVKNKRTVGYYRPDAMPRTNLPLTSD